MKPCLFLLALFLFFSFSRAQTLVPIKLWDGTSSNELYTGLEWCPNLTRNGQDALTIANLYDRLYTVRLESTSESVTDGVALRINFDANTKFDAAFTEVNGNGVTFTAGYAGATFYAKASHPLAMHITTSAGTSGDFNLTTDWQKINIPLSPLLTGLAASSLFEFCASAVQTQAGYVIIDRFGLEQTFNPSPTINPQPNTDLSIPSESLMIGAQYLDSFRLKIESRQPTKIFGWGNSIANGTQENKGQNVHPVSGTALIADTNDRFYGRLADKLRHQFTYDQIFPVAKARGGGQITSATSTTFKTEILAQHTDGDLVVIEFGANDFNGNGITVPTFISQLTAATAQYKAHGLQVLVTTPTLCVYDVPGCNAALEPQLTAAMKTFSAANHVAVANILKLMTYRGDKYGWAWEANGCHPDYWGHELMAQLMMAMVMKKTFTWSPSQDFPERVWQDVGTETAALTVSPLLVSVFPNPAAGPAVIRWNLPAGEKVHSLRIHALNGQVIRDFGSSASSTANQMAWDGRNAAGALVPGGLYFVRLRGEKTRWTQKIIVP